jgi:hypothetical protein
VHNNSNYITNRNIKGDLVSNHNMFPLTAAAQTTINQSSDVPGYSPPKHASINK